jgi:hypothetical protein
MERRQRELQQVARSTADESIVKGKITVLGGGDLAIDVAFPVMFTEEPHMTFGGAVKGTVDATAGAFPMISVMVGRWVMLTPDATEERNIGRRFYVGAQLLVAAETTLDVIAHYQFSGMAITNPTGALSDLTTDSQL